MIIPPIVYLHHTFLLIHQIHTSLKQYQNHQLIHRGHKFVALSGSQPIHKQRGWLDDQLIHLLQQTEPGIGLKPEPLYLKNHIEVLKEYLS